MADSLKLLIGGPAALYVIIFGTVSVLAPVLFEYKRYVAFLKWLTLSLFAYIVAFAAVHVPWIEAAKGLLVRKVSLDATFLTTLVAVLGTTISPYLFVWQASQEAEDRRVDKNGSKTSLMRKGPAAKVPGQLKKILGQFPRPGFLLRNRSEASSVYRQGDRSAVSPPLTYRVAP